MRSASDGRTVSFLDRFYVLMRFSLGILIAAAACIWFHVPEKLRLGQMDMPWTGNRLSLAFALSGCGLCLCGIAIRAWRWNVIVGGFGRRLPLGRLIHIYLATLFVGTVSPGRMGELGRVWFIAENCPSLGRRSASVVVDRLFDMIPTLVIVSAVCAVIGLDRTTGLAPAIEAICGLLALACVAILSYPSHGYGLICKIVIGVMRRAGSRLGQQSEVLARDKISLSRPTAVKAAALSVLSHMLFLGQTFLFATSLSISVSPLLIYGVTSIATLVAALPLSVGGVGTREVTVIYLLGLTGVGQSQAVLYSFLNFLNFLLVLAICFAAFMTCPRPQVASRRAEDELPQPAEGASAS